MFNTTDNKQIYTFPVSLPEEKKEFLEKFQKEIERDIEMANGDKKGARQLFNTAMALCEQHSIMHNHEKALNQQEEFFVKMFNADPISFLDAATLLEYVFNFGQYGPELAERILPQIQITEAESEHARWCIDIMKKENAILYKELTDPQKIKDELAWALREVGITVPHNYRDKPLSDLATYTEISMAEKLKGGVEGTEHLTAEQVKYLCQSSRRVASKFIEQRELERIRLPMIDEKTEEYDLHPLLHNPPEHNYESIADKLLDDGYEEELQEPAQEEPDDDMCR